MRLGSSSSSSSSGGGGGGGDKKDILPSKGTPQDLLDLKEENDNLKRQLKSLKDLLRQQMIKNGNDDGAAALRETHREDIERLTRRLREKDDEMDGLTSKITNLEMKVKDLDKMSMLESETKTLRTERDDLREKYLSANKTKEDLLDRCDKLDTLNKKQRDELIQLSNETTRMSNDRETIDSELAKALKTVSVLREKVSSANKRRAEAQAKAAEIQGELAEARERSEVLEKQMNALRGELEETKNSNATESAAKKESEAALRDSISRLNDATIATTRLEKELAESEAALEATKGALATCEAKLSAERSKCETLARDLEEVSVAAKLKTKRSLDLSKNLRSQLSKLRSNYARLEDAHRKLSAERPKTKTKSFQLRASPANPKRSAPSANDGGVAAALAERLRRLLEENEKERERVRFLESTVRMLQKDATERKRGVVSPSTVTAPRQAKGGDENKVYGGGFDAAV